MPGPKPGRPRDPLTRRQRRHCRAPLLSRLRLPLVGALLACLLPGPAARAAVPRTESWTPAPQEAPKPRRGGTLRYIQEPVESLDPRTGSDVYACTIINQIHRGLLQYSNNLTPVPCLARTWTISRDGREYTFELQPGVLFQHGREVTADDVVFSIERIFDPRGDTGLAGQYLGVIEGALAYHQKKTPRLTGVVALGRHTVRIRLAQPSGSFLWSMAMVQVGIVPRDVVERVGDAEFGRHPIGCGPFRFVSSDTSQTLLVAYEGYFRGRANLDSLVFTTPRTNATALGPDMLLQGRVDMAEIPGYRRKEVARAPGLRLISRRELSLSFVGMNCDLPPLDNWHVRRALAMATDREAMLAANPEGHVLPTGVLPPGMSCYSPEIKLLPHNVVTARAELAAAGYPGGKGLKEIVYFSSRSSSRSRKSDSLLVAGWRQVGLPIKVQFSDWSALSDGVDRGTLPLFSLSWVADIPDPDSFLGALFTSSSPYNYFRYRDAEVDSLLGQGRVLVDPRTRGGIYTQIEKHVLDEGTMIPLFNSTLAYGIRSTVHGLNITPLGISCVDFSYVWMEEGSGDRAVVE